MRQWIICATILIGSSITLGAAPAATPATTAPPPAARADAALDTPTKVLITPFAEVNEQQQPDWISRAIQQAVADELASLAGVEVVPNDPAAPLPSTAQAKAAGIKYIIRANIQRLNGELRVTGRVQNVDDGKIIGGFKSTGPANQLFAIEDSITSQLKRVIAPMEADLEDPRPVAGGGPVRGGNGVQPATVTRGVFEGSDLQRALEDRDYLRRTQRRVPGGYDSPVYYPPQQMYPPYPGYGYGYGWGGGWPGWWNGGRDVIIINPGKGHHHGGGGGGGHHPFPPSGPPISHVQTQRLRDAAVNPGQSGNFIGPNIGQAPRTPANTPGASGTAPPTGRPGR